ncbi:MAG: PP2C family protein-serine/threonine phosphatase [Actinomycetota bacterium]
MSDERQRNLELQRLLLPASLPPIGCTEAAAAYAAHNDDLRVGGDWYDLVDRADDQVVAIVGDVVGHGLTQIGVMGQLRAASNALARVSADPLDLLTGLDAFAKDLPGARGTTMVVVMLDGSTTGRIASAGHPPLLRVTPDGEVSLIEEGRRPPIGVVGTATKATFDVAIDDVLLMFTDGLVERRDRSIDDRMAELGAFVHEHVTEPCSTIAELVMDEFADQPDDDVAVLVLRPRNHRSEEYRLQQRIQPTASVRVA